MCDDCYARTLSEEEIRAHLVYVTNTVTWLDGVKPNWRELVDWDVLNIDSPSNCIAGQVFREEGKASHKSGYGWLYKNHPGMWDRVDMAFEGKSPSITSSEMTQVWLYWHRIDQETSRV